MTVVVLDTESYGGPSACELDLSRDCGLCRASAAGVGFEGGICP